MIRTILVVALSLQGAELSGQMALAETAAPPPVVRDGALARVDSLWAALDAAASLVEAEALLEGRPDDVEASWRAARACVGLGMLATEEDEQDAWFTRGEAHAVRAVAPDSTALDPLFWLAAAKGRRALQAGPREAVRLGTEVKHLSERILELDPDHAGAHNVLGKLNYEVRTLSRVERFLARVVLGDDGLLSTTSWENAERHLLRAVVLEPRGVLYRYDLARAYLRLDRETEAEAELRAALELSPRYPPDELIQADARRLLDRIEARNVSR